MSKSYGMEGKDASRVNNWCQVSWPEAEKSFTKTWKIPIIFPLSHVDYIIFSWDDKNLDMKFKPLTCLFILVNIMAVDDLEMQGAKASAAMVLT